MTSGLVPMIPGNDVKRALLSRFPEFHLPGSALLEARGSIGRGDSYRGRSVSSRAASMMGLSSAYARRAMSAAAA